MMVSAVERVPGGIISTTKHREGDITRVRVRVSVRVRGKISLG